MEALEVVSSVIGQDRTAIRISPFSPFQGMGQEPDPFHTWGYVCGQFKERFPKLAYISVTDPRLDSGQGRADNKKFTSDTFRAIIRGVDVKSVATIR